MLLISLNRGLHCDNWSSRELKDKADGAVANWIFEDGRPLMSATTPAFQELLEMISHYTLITKTIYKTHSRDTIKGTLMKKSMDNMEIELKRLQVVAEKYGKTIFSDGWKKCKRQPIINLVMVTRDGVVFIDCIDTKSHQKHVKFIIDFIQRVWKNV